MVVVSPYRIRWGILATGWIAEKFAKDLLTDPSTRGAGDIQHEIVAVASSTSAEKAKEFIQKIGHYRSVMTYGSYEELVADPQVQVIYVATPHSHHYQNVMLCLYADKHVLCEKAFTVNAAQARRLCETARERKLFLMEAVWTRYFPLSIQIRSRIKAGELGDVYRVIADLSFDDDVETKYGSKHRMVNLDLAGGVLLDLGVYSITWCFQALYDHLPLDERKPPKVVSVMSHYDKTGADEQTTVLLCFSDAPTQGQSKHQAHGIAMSGIRVATVPGGRGVAGPAIRIQGTKGEIQISPPAFRPTKYCIIRKGVNSTDATSEEVECEIPGHGMFWEADEVGRCIRDNKLESESLPWEESITIMDVMDEVRRQGNLTYPVQLESLEYPLTF